MLETTKAPIKIQHNEHIRQLSLASQTYISLIKGVRGKLSNDELLKNALNFLETYGLPME